MFIERGASACALCQEGDVYRKEVASACALRQSGGQCGSRRRAFDVDMALLTDGWRRLWSRHSINIALLTVTWSLQNDARLTKELHCIAKYAIQVSGPENVGTQIS